MPLIFLASVFTLSKGEVITPLSTIVDNGMWLAYSICLHARYGQTVGKMLFKVKVVTSDGNDITFLHALKRDIVFIVFAILALVTFYTHGEYYSKYNESMAFIDSFEFTIEDLDSEEFKTHMDVISSVWKSPVMWIGFVSMFYFLLEVITMLSNQKRRAIHDFIAGTEVRRLQLSQLREGGRPVGGRR